MQRWLFGNADSLNRKIFRTAVVVGLFTLLVKTGTTAKELVVAGTFGRSEPAQRRADVRLWHQLGPRHRSELAAWSLWLIGQQRLQAVGAVAARSDIDPEAAS